MRNGDMKTTLPGVVNTFVIFLARIIGNIVDGFLSRGEERQGDGMAYFVTVIIAEIALGDPRQHDRHGFAATRRSAVPPAAPVGRSSGR